MNMFKKFNSLLLLVLLGLYGCGGGGTDPTSIEALPGGGTGTGGGGGVSIGSIAFTPALTTMELADSIVPVMVKDVSGLIVPDGTTVTYSAAYANGSISSGSATTVSGIANLPFVASYTGSVTITATSGSVSSSDTATVSAPTITLAASSTTVASTLSTSVTATVKDSGNVAPLNGVVNVLFTSSNTGAGTITSVVPTVLATGVATATFTGVAPGSSTVTAIIDSATSNTQAMTVTNPPDSIVVTSSADTIQHSGATLDTSTITASVRDILGNPLPDGTTVTFSISSSTLGSLSSQTATTVGGAASVVFSSFSTNGVVTIGASVVGLFDSTSVRVIDVDSVTISPTPTDLFSGDSITVEATVLDAGGTGFVDDGTVVDFVLDNMLLGSLTSTGVTTNGVATSTFTVSDASGTAGITASVGGVSDNVSINTTTTESIVLTPSLSTLTYGGISTITIDVNKTGALDAPNGTVVDISLSDPALGTIASQATVYSGIATAIFTSSGVAGVATITASLDSIVSTTDITIDVPAVNSIVYLDATPSSLSISGGGGADTSLVRFEVKLLSGDPVADGTVVTFTMTGPSGGALPAAGGEYIGLLDATPTTADTVTTAGIAGVQLSSGTSHGPVTIIATVDDGVVTKSTSSAPITIGSELPSATHFSMEPSKYSYPALYRDLFDNQQVHNDLTSTIVVNVADRFGNYSGMVNTEISFFTEAGALAATSIAADATGTATVGYRTQDPAPADIVSTTADKARLTALNATYSTTYDDISNTGINPRDGWVKVIGVVDGEETFFDENGNGRFDRSLNTSACPSSPAGVKCECDGGVTNAYSTTIGAGASCPGVEQRSEGFMDQDEPFVDSNDNGLHDNTTSSDPIEIFVDEDGSSSHSLANGIWDGPDCIDPVGSGCSISKKIWKEITLKYTGDYQIDQIPTYLNCEVSATTFAIADGGNQNISFLMGDENLNPLAAGTTVTVTLTGGDGSLTGVTSYTVPDLSVAGPTNITFNLADGTPGDGVPPVANRIDITTSSADVLTCPTVSIIGTID